MAADIGESCGAIIMVCQVATKTLNSAQLCLLDQKLSSIGDFNGASYFLDAYSAINMAFNLTRRMLGLSMPLALMSLSRNIYDITAV